MIGRRRKGVSTPTSTDEMRQQAYAMLAEADRADAVSEAARNRVPLAEAVERAKAAVAELESARDDVVAREAEAERKAVEAQRQTLAYASVEPADFGSQVEQETRVIVATQLVERRTAEAEGAATARAEVERRLTEAQRALAEATIDLEDFDADVADDPFIHADKAYAAHVARTWPTILLDETNTADRPEALARLRDLLLLTGEGRKIAEAVKADTYAEVAHRFAIRDYDVLAPDGLHIGGANGRTANLPG